MKKIFSLSAILFLILPSCKDSTVITESNPGKYFIKGKITLENTAIPDVSIEVLNSTLPPIHSDQNGEFQIELKNPGQYNLAISKLLEDFKVLSLSTPINISEELTDLGKIDFNNPPNLYKSVISQNENSVVISWTPTFDELFQSYQVFRGDSSTFNQETGELLQTITTRNDTSFSDIDIETGYYYYYKIYTHTMDNKITGSNVLSVYAEENLNYLENGDFEKISNGILPEFFIQTITGTQEFDYYAIDNSTTKRNNQSLKITFIDSISFPHPDFGNGSGLGQRIFANNLTPGKNYKLSFWTKARFGGWQIRLYKNYDFENPIILYDVKQSDKWVKQKFSFNFDSDTESLLFWIYVGDNFAKDGVVEGWIDDIRIN